jgi:hypothetical protein
MVHSVKLALSPVAVEKGTKAVILPNFSLCAERRFNKLQVELSARNTSKKVFQQPRLIATVTLGCRLVG